MSECLDTPCDLLEDSVSQRLRPHSQQARNYQEAQTPHSPAHAQQACPFLRAKETQGPSIPSPGFL